MGKMGAKNRAKGKMMALVLAVAVVLSMSVTLPVFAEDDYSLTINNTVSGHTYTAYQIFTGTKATNGADDDALGDPTWGDDITDAGKVALYKAYGIKDNGAEITATSTKLNDGATIQALIDEIADKDNTTTSESDKAVKFANVFYTTDTAGNVTEKDGLLKTPAAAQIKVANGTSVVFDGLDAGYYLVNDSYSPATGEENGVDYSIARIAVQVIGNTTINNKADKPTLDKKIKVQRGQQTVEVDNSNGSIGDKVEYTLPSKVPNMEGYKSYLYEITDTMTDGLTFNDDVAIKIDNETISRVYKGDDGKFYASEDAATAKTEGTNVTKGFTVESTVDADGNTTVKIYLVNFIQYQEKAGQSIEVTYSATINEKAKNDFVEENKAKLDYSNHPETSDKGENGEPDTTNPKGNTPEETVKTFTHGIELFKVDGEDSTKKLEGAAFTLEGDAQNVTVVNGQKYVLMTSEEAASYDGNKFYMLKDGTYTQTVPGSTVGGKTVSEDDYVSTTELYKLVDTVTKEQNSSTTYKAAATTNAQGYIEFSGLGEGVYKLVETKAPAGYNELKDPIYIAVKFNVADDEANATAADAFKVYRYKGTPVPDETPEMPASLDNNDNWELLTQSQQITLESDLTVGNYQGTQLPETGGIGTTIFYVVGALLVIGAGVLLITRRRMHAE